MSNLFVPNTADAGDRFEDSFIEAHPALGLRLTSNSGAYHGDGDARAKHVDYGALSFALEGKVRLDVPLAKTPKKHCKPTAAEWRKAMGDPNGKSRDSKRGQLKKFDRSAVRLFAVFNVALSTYDVFLPGDDFERLMETLGHPLGAGDPVVDSTSDFGIRHRGLPESRVHRFAYPDWARLYALIETHREA